MEIRDSSRYALVAERADPFESFLLRMPAGAIAELVRQRMPAVIAIHMETGLDQRPLWWAAALSSAYDPVEAWRMVGSGKG